MQIWRLESIRTHRFLLYLLPALQTLSRGQLELTSGYSLVNKYGVDYLHTQLCMYLHNSVSVCTVYHMYSVLYTDGQQGDEV